MKAKRLSSTEVDIRSATYELNELQKRITLTFDEFDILKKLPKDGIAKYLRQLHEERINDTNNRTTS